jgi:hypothetical protein
MQGPHGVERFKPGVIVTCVIAVRLLQADGDGMTCVKMVKSRFKSFFALVALAVAVTYVALFMRVHKLPRTHDNNPTCTTLIQGSPDSAVSLDQRNAADIQQVIILRVPKELSEKVFPDSPSNLLDLVSVILYPEEGKIFAMRDGTFDVTKTVKGPLINYDGSIHIIYNETRNAYVGAGRWEYSAEFVVESLPGTFSRVSLDARVRGKPMKGWKPSFNATDATVQWKLEKNLSKGTRGQSKEQVGG